MPRKMRRAALRSALSVKAANGNIILVEDLSLDHPKTQVMAELLNRLVGETTALILIPEKDEKYEAVTKSTDNLPDAKLLHARYLNIRDLLGFDKVVMPVEALDVITSYLS
jgi:large subunit ribosomal protein L4